MYLNICGTNGRVSSPLFVERGEDFCFDDFSARRNGKDPIFQCEAAFLKFSC
jgi:hypothetical protein